MSSSGQLLLLLLCFLTLSTLVTGTCSVYVYTQNQTMIQRCRKTQECIDESVLSSIDNLYVLEKVFRSTQPRPGVALIINYNISHQSSNGYRKSYVEQIGWSSSGVYTRIRPAVLLAFQPGWLLWILSAGIDNYCYPKTINLHLNITARDLPAQATYGEVKEALGHLTAKLDYNATAKVAYAWNPTQLLLGDIIILTTVIVCSVLSLTLSAIILPKHKPSRDYLPRVLCFPCVCFVSTETGYQWKMIYAIDADIHSKIRQIIFFAILGIGTVVGIITFIAGVKQKWSALKTVLGVVAFSLMCITMLYLVIAMIPLIIFITIYPVEILSVISFVIAMFIANNTGMLVFKWFIHKTYKSSTSRYYCSNITIAIVFYIISPLTFYLLLGMYLSLLKSLSESPISQFSQLILSFVPSITATIVGFLLTKKLRSTPKQKTDTSNESQHNFCSINNSSSGDSCRDNETNLPTQV